MYNILFPYLIMILGASLADSTLPSLSTTVRTLEVRLGSTNERRSITQYHYEKWPDFGVPEGDEIGNFLNLVNHVADEFPSREGNLGILSKFIRGF